jgi:imidazolonepropionase-like amidohydrolase
VAVVRERAADVDLVLRGAHLFDGLRVHDGLRDVAIAGGGIVEVSPEPRRGNRIIDVAGGWVLPGLIDTHVHLYDVRSITDEGSLRAFQEHDLPRHLDDFLQHGVTTVKSVGDPTEHILQTRADLADGTLQGPRLLTTGCGITASDGHPASTVFAENPWARARFTGEVANPQEMRALVHRLADLGVDAIKLLSEGACESRGASPYVWQNVAFDRTVELVRLPLELLRAGIETAHERGLRVTVHTTQQDAAREAIDAGADGLEHGVTVEPVTDSVLFDVMRLGDVTYTPTLWIHDAIHPAARGNLKKAGDAGVRLALGSDSFCGRGQFGKNTLDEAKLMVAAGLDPIQVLVAGTSAAARHCGRPDLGVIEPGRRADLIVVGADPTKDIQNLRGLALTIVDGRITVDRR